MNNIYCIRAKQFPNGIPSGFTSGSYYEVKNGKIIDDQGIPRPVCSKDEIRTIEDIRFFHENDEWGWIGEFRDNTFKWD